MTSFKINPFELPENMVKEVVEELQKLRESFMKGEYGVILFQIKELPTGDYSFSGGYVGGEKAKAMVVLLCGETVLAQQEKEIDQYREFVISNSKNNLEKDSGNK